jgi:hypothetical protein
MNKALTAAVKSWKTTVTGILVAASAWIEAIQKILDSDPATNPDWTIVFALTLAAIGLIFSRDADKTSTDLGLK